MCNQVVDPLSNLYDITLRHFSHFWDVESAKELIHLLSNASPSIVAAVECDTVSGCFITVQKLERELEEWAQKHPVQAAFYILDGVLFLQPELLSVPFLGALGFRLIGVEAGQSSARCLQRILRIVSRICRSDSATLHWSTHEAIGFLSPPKRRYVRLRTLGSQHGDSICCSSCCGFPTFLR